MLPTGRVITGADAESASEVSDAEGEGLPFGATKASRDKEGRRINSGPERCDWWSTEPDVGRVADGIPSRVDRLKGLGNAVVPQVAEFTGRQMMSEQYLQP